MRSITKAHWLGAALSIASPIPATADGSIEGEFAVLTGVKYDKSNFNTDNNRKASPLNSEGESDTGYFALPLGRITYNFDNEKTYSLFAGTSRDDIVVGDLAFEIGGAVRFSDSSSIDISFLPTLVNDETWSDPYLVDQDRKDTDVSGNAFLLGYKNILSSGVDLSAGYYYQDIDEELSAQFLLDETTRQSLDRNGDGYYLSAKRRFGLSKQSFLEPALYAHKFSADGDAMSFTRYSAGLTFGTQFRRSTLGVSVRVSDTEFEGRNPVFSKEQDDLGYKFNLSYEYRHIFGLENWSFISLMGYSETDSNITFYDEKGAFAGVGVSYQF